MNVAIDDTGSATDTVCEKLCKDKWELVDLCEHYLVRCSEWGHVWDGFAQCSHHVWWVSGIG